MEEQVCELYNLRQSAQLLNLHITDCRTTSQSREISFTMARPRDYKTPRTFGEARLAI